MAQLFDVGSFLDGFGSAGSDGKDLFAERKRKGWHGGGEAPEPRCCLDEPKPHMFLRGVTGHAQWKRGIYGPTLSEIKADRSMPGRIAPGVVSLVNRIFGSVRYGGWALVTPPPRWHLDWNFAIATGELIACELGIPFYYDVAEPLRTRQRVNVEYTVKRLPKERNIIVFDDICTTGSTLISMGSMLGQYCRTVFNVVAIDNKAVGL